MSLPYAVQVISAAIAGVDRDLERSAAVLGARPSLVLTKITLPLIRGGEAAAFMFTFLSSFNNVTISLFIVGPTTQTFPITLFRMAQETISPMLSAIASVAIAASVVIMLALERWFKVYTVLQRARPM